MHTAKKAQKQQQQNAQLTKHDAFVYWSSSCAVCWWPIFRKLGTCSSTDALSARTLLTENICESVQQILQHRPAERKEKKQKTKTKQNKKTLRTVLTSRCVQHITENICESVQQILQHSPAEKKKNSTKTKQKQKHAQLTKHDAFLYWSSFCPMWWWATARKLGRCYSGLFHVGGLLA